MSTPAVTVDPDVANARPLSQLFDSLILAGLPQPVSRQAWADPAARAGAGGSLQLASDEDFRVWQRRLDDPTFIGGVSGFWVGPLIYVTVVGSLRVKREDPSSPSFPLTLWWCSPTERNDDEEPKPLVFEPAPTELVSAEQLKIVPPDEPFDDMASWVEALNQVHISCNQAVGDIDAIAAEGLAKIIEMVSGPAEETPAEETPAEEPAHVELQVVQTPAGTEEAAGKPTEADR